MRRISVIRRGPALALLMCLASCGGGGDDDVAPPPPVANRAPVFTSAAAVSVPENSAGVVYTATATDADGDALTFAVVGGADAAQFQITSAGALSFRSPPDFELAGRADANRDNVYLVQISVSDGRLTTALDLAITVTDVPNDDPSVTLVTNSIAQPVFAAEAPGDTLAIHVVSRLGEIRGVLTSGRSRTAPLINLASQISTDGTRGLLGLAFAPDYATSSAFYVFLTNTAGNIEVRRYRGSVVNGVSDPARYDPIITIQHSAFNNNNGGWIGFGPDGYLYVGVGDGGGTGDPQGNAQNRNSLLGKILRLDVNADAYPADAARNYAIPASNPFAAGGGAAEVWALGLRNPYRASFDAATGNLWIGDVGENNREEIDLMRPTDGGANFGWNAVEGTVPFAGQTQAAFTPPVAEYAHGTGAREGRAVIGGYVYRGAVVKLQGQYVFGDNAGKIFSFPASQATVGQTLSGTAITVRSDLAAPTGSTYGNLSSFAVDSQGNLYVLDTDRGLFKVVPSTAP